MYFRKWPIAFVGISSGLAFLILSSLDIWLSESGFSKSMIGLFSLAHAPYAFKYILSVFLEKWHLLQRFTLKKSWIIVSHLMIFVSLFTLAFTDPSKEVLVVFLLILLVKLGNSVQNITSYSFQIDRTPTKMLPVNAALFAFGFRVGMFVSSYGILMVAHYYSWRTGLICLAILSALSSFVFFIQPEPLVPETVQRFNRKIAALITSKSRIKQIFTECLIVPLRIFSRHEINWKLVLLIIFFMKTGDTLCHKMGKLMYLEIGFSKAEIANIVKCFGLIATTIGGFIIVKTREKYIITKALAVTVFLHSVTCSLYLVMYHIGHVPWALALTIFVENFTGGMFMSTFLAFLYYYSNTSPYPTVLYTFFFGLYSVNNMFVSAISGLLADSLGWDKFFLLAITISLAISALIFKCYLIFGKKKTTTY